MYELRDYILFERILQNLRNLSDTKFLPNSLLYSVFLFLIRHIKFVSLII